MLKISVVNNDVNAVDVLVDGFYLNLVDGIMIVGNAKLIYKDCFELVDFSVKDNNVEYSKFFFRGILYKLGATGQLLRVKKDDRLISYGFIEKNGSMELDCSKAIYK